MSGLSAMFISNLLPYFAFIWSLSYVLMFRMMLSERDNGHYVRHLIVPLATLAFTGLFVLLPIRTVINKCVSDTNIKLDQRETYSTVFDKFTCDYDRENPVTKREGFMRVLEHRIKIAQNNEKVTEEIRADLKK